MGREKYHSWRSLVLVLTSMCSTCAGLWSERLDKFTQTERLEQCLLQYLLNKLCCVVAVFLVPQEHSVPSLKGLSTIWSSVNQEPSHEIASCLSETILQSWSSCGPFLDVLGSLSPCKCSFLSQGLLPSSSSALSDLLPRLRLPICY